MNKLGRDPVKEICTPETISKVMTALGSRKTEKKAKSSRVNGKKGGRPRNSK